jgi:hypothetical protein
MRLSFKVVDSQQDSALERIARSPSLDYTMYIGGVYSPVSDTGSLNSLRGGEGIEE